MRDQASALTAAELPSLAPSPGRGLCGDRRMLGNPAVSCAGLFSAAVSRAVCVAGTRGPPARLNVRLLHGSSRAPLEVRAKPEPGRRVHEIPEYIPPRKAKNPMKMVGVAWAIGFPSGIILFLLTKREVDKNRLKQLKAHQKMKASNMGEYERVRYRRPSLGPEGEADTKA
ncbi:actin-related protein 2/3 complex subunit 2 [Platysternon megacephalum]|uniref:Actin-related protein 2/3 complex subunit 2 n=1 Tax=Platysternon megacephalum TaxID=55544 RepID=A0A4D9E0Q7_9SAUR|nr:actin-related protein 2/3 complex subunit 2 [Platysternon megacephalum]